MLRCYLVHCFSEAKPWYFVIRTKTTVKVKTEFEIKFKFD